MEESLLLQELEALAAELAVDVRYEDLDSRGGLCRFGGRTCLLLNRNLTVSERVNLFAEGLADLPLEGVFMRPRVREFLERRVSKGDTRSV
jgi:hypothetical protein